MSEENPKCCENMRLAGSIRFYSCRARAKVIRDGKPYCDRHDPVKFNARQEKRNARWDAENAARKKSESESESERAERERRADCFDDLLDALEEIVGYSGGADTALEDEYVMERVHAAIAKARGE